MAMLIPRPSSALQLHWGSGATTLSFAEATRCTLVVQADSSESAIALGVATAVGRRQQHGHQPGADRRAACLRGGPWRRCWRSTSPRHRADSAAHLRTIHFCSEDGPASTIADYLLDLPAESRGRFKAVALDPNDSTQVIESNEVTFNGGYDGEYPVAVLRVATIHRSTEFRVIAVGTGLERTATLSLEARDESWSQPLMIDSRSDHQVSAVASLAAAVPECVLRAEGMGGSVSDLTVLAEVPPSLPPLSPTGSSCQENFKEHKPGFPIGMIQPKDFAFVLGGWTPQGEWTFHLFYIRQNQETKKWRLTHGGPDSTERNIGHAVSNDLDDWPQDLIDTTAIVSRPGAANFDSRHVWAPSIVLYGLTYYMFYTGVDDVGDQRMGLATSTDLVTWTQRDQPIIDYTQLGSWANPTSTTDPFTGNAQFRDPFVMPDPDPAHPGQWLMYFVTIAADAPSRMEVGVARSDGDFTVWRDSYGLPSTRHPYGAGFIVESPHVFRYQDRWWLFYTANNLDVWGISHPSDPTDPGTALWTPTMHLDSLVIDEATGLPSNTYDYWKASEFLEVNVTNDVAYLAAYNDQSVGISYIPVQLATTPYLFKEHCPVSAAGVESDLTELREVGLRVSGAVPSRLPISLRVELPAASSARLAIYDVLGRRVRTLHDGGLARGTFAFSWDGRNESGHSVGPGLYFARFQTIAGERRVRMVMIR